MIASTDQTKFFKHIEKFHTRLVEKKNIFEKASDSKTVDTLEQIIADIDKAISDHKNGKKPFDVMYAEVASHYLYAEIHIDMIEQQKSVNN